MAKTPKKLPIDPSSDDPFYRYQTHQLNIQVVGRGKMIRTYFLNCEEVAADLHVPAEYLPNFFAQNIGAQANFDPKKPERERASISGEYSLEQLSDMFALFLRKFIMCGNCTLAELSYHPLSKRIGVKCRSCGWKTYVDEMDLHPKFQRFVQNHPPPKTATLDKNAVKGQEAVRKKEKDDAKLMKAAEGMVLEDVDDDEVEWSTSLSEDAQAKRAAEMVPEKLKALVELELPSSSSSSSTTPAAPAAAAAATTTTSDASKSSKVLSEDELKSGAEKVRATLGSNDDALKALASVGSNDENRCVILCEALFASLPTMAADITKHAALLQAFVSGNASTRATALLDWWSGRILALPEAERAALKKKVAVQCKALYDADIVTEELFLSWANGGGKSSALAKLAAPFLDWLAQAEEEDDE